ncbi:MAG TPA: AAA family ATPase [Candidatus Paceibacterota bacterium]|nr:AAA family ATPase [Candidatus Paceibacterota bacterium]
MKLVVIVGPEAVGKMTVGQELEKITSLKLFHNHMTIELVSPFFSYSTPTAKKLVFLFREEIFKAVASSDLEGLIFTYQWNFEVKAEWDYIENLAKIFKDKGAEVIYVELEADIEERVRRNKTEHRLKHKPSKNREAGSEHKIREHFLKHRVNSEKDEVKEKNYIKINNTDIDAATVAQTIKTIFNL